MTARPSTLKTQFVTQARQYVVIKPWDKKLCVFPGEGEGVIAACDLVDHWGHVIMLSKPCLHQFMFGMSKRAGGELDVSTAGIVRTVVHNPYGKC